MGEFVHNDLKCNNGVLDQLLPCYSRFGKSDVFGKAKNAVPKPSRKTPLLLGNTYDI